MVYIWVMHGRILRSAVLILPLLAGCAGQPSHADEPEEQEIALAQSFGPHATGTIHGHVIWDGPVPVAEETLVRAIAFNPTLHRNPARFRTPHVPRVHARNRGVENAVVYLRGIDPARSRPWHHAGARVEFRDRELVIQQGDRVGNIGFVRQGSAIEIVNRDVEYHNLHGRGAAFFAQPLLKHHHVHERKLADAGVVDLTCGAGYYWMHAHLFVAEHPYFVQTDAAGRFTLEGVPAGTYELVCWLPSWHVVRKQFDPETGIVARLTWVAAREQVQMVVVRTGTQSETTYTWTRSAFEGEGK